MSCFTRRYKKEREYVTEIIDEINVSISRLNMRYELIKWETHTIPQMGRPQEIINRQLDIKQCDIFIGILWNKFGSPTGKNIEKNVEYDSGTQEEFEMVYSEWKSKGKPKILFFKSNKRLTPSQIDTEQYMKVENFFSNFSHNREHPGLYKEYKTINEFKKNLRISLIQYIVSLIEKSNENNDGELNYLDEYGIKKIFVPNLNELRNMEKKESLINTNCICLVAHSGYSFIAQFGHRFRDIIEEHLRSGKRFKAILTNPWSESGFFISLAEVQKGIKNPLKDKNFDPINIINEAKWYQVKFKDSLNGYDILKSKYGDLIQIRFTRYEIPASVLLTDLDCFIEPYLPINLNERYEKGMLTYEIKVDKTSYLYKHNKKYFDFLWEISDDIE
ncbi:MAG: hypothetical protein ACLVKT_15405, partial [Intestinibacter bartlettii]|uniref:hypothetical protein n=1 Tax=Intestinibacter bartlettii TaxID=261299 RepID=UPI00399A930F